MPRKIKIAKRLWDAIGEVEIAGMKLSNIAFNLGQQKDHVLTDRDRECMDESRKEWDAAERKLSALLK